MIRLPDIRNIAKSSFEKIESYEIMGPNNKNTQFLSDKNGALRFRLPPEKCLQDHERYRIDRCNWCYCDEYFQRICTDWKCPDDGGKPFQLKQKKCLPGARYKRGRCKFCYCSLDRSIVCSTRKNCTDSWWYNVQGASDTFPVLPTTKRVPSSKKLTGFFRVLPSTKSNHHLRYNEEQCIEGSYYKVDSCNFCICFNGNEMCSSKRCPANELDILNDPESSFPEISEDTESDNIMDSYVDSELIPDEKAKRIRFRPAPKKCNKKLEKYRIDWCNWCYCNAQYQRVCTDWKCNHLGGDQPPRETKNCFVGTRFERGKCKYCYCSAGYSLICRTRDNCSPNRRRRSSNSIRTTLNYKCDVGVIQRLEDCNYCVCTHRRKWKCTQDVCPSNNAHHLGALRMSYHQNVDGTPKKCKIGEKLRLDACNYCYCNENRVRVCSDHKCHLPVEVNSRFPLDSIEENDCKIGTRFRQGECNYCYCNTNHKLVCSVNQCLRRSIDYANWKCVVGTLHEIDDCNTCRCTHKGKWKCTNNVCSYNNDHRNFLRSDLGMCTEGYRKEVDGCNYCVCIGGAMWCTQKLCLNSKYPNFHFNPSSSEFKGSNLIQRPLRRVTLTDEDCLEGEVTHDRCNMCVCTQGQYMCTSKHCSGRNLRKERLWSRFRSRNIKKHRMTQGTKQKCIPGKKYLPDDFDPKCPNECICDRDELLCTKRDCFDNWDLSNPFKWSLARIEISNRNPLNLMTQEKPCIEYEPLPSDDICNTCICLHARKVCTVANCDDGDSTDALSKIIQGSHGVKAKKKKSTFCEPFTFFSPDNNRFCRNCFCLYNGLALCLLNLCKYSKDIPHQNSPEELDEICKPGEIGYPTKCVTCTCSETAKWICTREELALCQERDCDVKDEFHMGFYPYCAGCKCAVKEWFCSIQDESCKDYSNVKCPLGTFIYNPKQYCSICLCGGYEKGAHNMCFTEAKCVRQVSTQKKRL